MGLDLLSAYLPRDRRRALATGRPLADRAAGAVLLADLAGFTPLADALTSSLGPQRGAEELTRLLNAVYDALIGQVHRYGGSVVSFIGDAVVGWFAGDDGLRAAACGLGMQEAMGPFAAVALPGGERACLSMKAGVAAGPVRRFLVGEPHLDLLAGATLERMGQAEQVARQGEVVVAPETARQMGDQVALAEWRSGFGVVAGLAVEVPPTPWPEAAEEGLTAEQLRPYLLPPVYERLLAGQGEFLADLRPAVALFLRFAGLDYEQEEAGAQLDAFVRWVQGVLARCGGHLLQLTVGDKGSFLYAAFGALEAHEDDAGRALAAAAELGQVPPELGFVTGVHIGLSRGRVRAGAYGSGSRRSYGAIGPEAVVACRLMEGAPVGEAWCSPSLYAAAEGQWAFERLAAVDLKGVAEAVAVYRPLGRVRGRGARVESALVGRRGELEAMTRLLAEAQTGQRRVLLLEGEAGIGKSRLLAELRRLAQQQGVAWLEGTGQSIEQGTPYRAWRDLLAALFGLDEGMGPAERRRVVQGRVAVVDPALAARAPLLNDVLRLELPETELTRSFDPQLRHESLTALVVELLRAAAAERPLAVVLEDGHWLDSLSWELALAVARALYEGPVLLALALRPLEETGPPEYSALAGLEGAAVVRLEGLPPEETVALAAARLGIAPEGLPAEVAGLIGGRAGGNPFFAEELAYVLRDSGVLTVEEGACKFTRDLESLGEQVPDTVEGVVLARIDRLPAEQQLTLKVAAVIGRSFLYRTLKDVHPRQVLAELLRAQLEELGRRDLTLVEALEPELSYLFKHVITQQVAYETLLFSRRRELHRAVAGWYERVYADALSPYYPLLVHHWNGAEDEEQERHYARLAGEQAAAQYANVEAVRYLSRALELTAEEDLEQRYALLSAREKVYYLQGAREAQRQDLEALEQLANALDDDRRRGEVALEQTVYSTAIGDYPAAVATAQRAVRLGQDAQDVLTESRGYQLWGKALWEQRDLVAARPRLEQALALAQATSLRSVEAGNLTSLGVVCFLQSDYAQARDYYDQSLHIYRECGDRRNEGIVLGNIGLTFYGQGDFDQSWSFLQQALHIAREVGDRRSEGRTLGNLGNAADLLGDYAESEKCYNEALRIFRQIADRGNVARSLINCGIISRRYGNYGEARDYLEEGLYICRDLGNPLDEASALNVLGTISTALGNYVEARDFFGRGLRLHREVGDRDDEAGSLGSLGFSCYHLGDYPSALEYAEQGLRIAQEIGARYREGEMLICLGHAHSGMDRLLEAATYYQQARDLWEELGTQHQLIGALGGLARVSLAQGQLARAKDCVEKILAHPEAGGSLDHALDDPVDIIQVYLTCYRVLQAHGDCRARDILLTAYQLLQERAARIDDEELRRSFLENVAARRELASAYQALLEGEGDQGGPA